MRKISFFVRHKVDIFYVDGKKYWRSYNKQEATVAEHAIDSADDGDIVNNGTYINIMFMLHVHMGYLYD